MTMIQLPFPLKQKDVNKLLESIDDKLLNCSEKFIRLQVKRPIEKMLSGKIEYYDSENPQYDWFNIYSIYCSNQQVNEACNKLWATIELTNVTSRNMWKKNYSPIGENFSGIFLLGTLIPTLHYSQLSAMISMLSSFGCIPLIINRTPYFLIRTGRGWMLFRRPVYLKETLGISAHGWHEQIIRVYDKFNAKGVELPTLNIRKIMKLKDLRNSLHYEILGDLRMWRIFKSRKAYATYLPLVIKSIELAIDNLTKIKKVTSGCDTRLLNLQNNLKKLELG